MTGRPPRTRRLPTLRTGSSSACTARIAEGFSLLLYEGGSVDDLVACAESRGATALYALADGAWVPYILGAPDFVNGSFRELFADGLSPLTPLVAKSDRTPATGSDGGGSASN